MQREDAGDHGCTLCPRPFPPAATLQGAYLTARTVVAHDGIRGLYKGFGTVVFGSE